MDAAYSPLSRTERLIAAGRVVLAGASLVAIWLDPTEPACEEGPVYGLMLAYLVYAVGVGLLVWRSRAPLGLQRLVTQSIDLALFSVFVYLTASVSSPFIAFFVFSIICGTMRWGWRGSLVSATVALGAFLGLGIWFRATQSKEEFQLGAFIIRGVYLGVVAVILGYMGRHEERVRMDIARLAAWPRTIRQLRERDTAAKRAASDLTPRKLEIVRNVASGHRNRVIADLLVITEGTVKIHLHRIYQKLGVDGRLELAVLARDRGIG